MNENINDKKEVDDNSINNNSNEEDNLNKKNNKSNEEIEKENINKEKEKDNSIEKKNLNKINNNSNENIINNENNIQNKQNNKDISSEINIKENIIIPSNKNEDINILQRDKYNSKETNSKGTLPKDINTNNKNRTTNKNIKTINENKKNKAHDRMEKLKKEGKSLLLGAPKKECTICHKFIESHLHPIHYNAHPSQIFKWMYLGNYDTACNISDLRRLGITYVLNLAGECKNTVLPKNITEYHLKTKDLADFDLIEYFEKANEFINKVRNSGGTMLIHCKYGVSRSPTFVAAYLTKYFGFSVQSALNFIRKKRPMINPNEGFLNQLEKYEQSFKKIRK